MELSNALFGNSRGEFELDRDMMNKIGEWDELMDLIGGEGYGCYNGLLGKEFETDTGGFKNKIFEISPYYWGDCQFIDEDSDCNTCKLKDKCKLFRPNFRYFPDDFTINWYKYPFRDSYSNKEVTADYLRKIFRNCIISIKAGTGRWDSLTPVTSDFLPNDRITIPFEGKEEEFIITEVTTRQYFDKNELLVTKKTLELRGVEKPRSTVIASYLKGRWVIIDSAGF